MLVMRKIMLLSVFFWFVSFQVLYSQNNYVNFSPYYKIGQDPRIGSDIPVEQLEAGLQFLHPYFSEGGGIRLFASEAPLDTVPYLAKAMGFETVILNVWLDKDTTSNNAQIASAIQLALDGVVDRIVVGSEVLLRAELTAEELVAYMLYVKSQVPDIPVTTADVYGVLLDNPIVLDACDWYFYNVYPFWEGSDLECSLYSFHQAYEAFEALADGKEIWISETGYPTDGNTVGAAAPNLDNALYYINHVRAWSQHHNIPLFLFEAFDEPWKWNFINPQEAYWGLSYYDAEADSLVWKEGMEELFINPIVVDTSEWACQFIENDVDSARISFTQIPTYGDQNGIICGMVDGIYPCDYHLVMYIKVAGRWWVKPTFTNRVTRLDCNGHFCIDVVTGGLDRYATEYRLFLFERDWIPPSIGGQINLPDSLYTNTITHAVAIRTAFDYGTVGIFEYEEDVYLGDTFDISVFVEDIVDVRYFSGSIGVSSSLTPQFVEVHSIYDEANLDVNIFDEKRIGFSYSTIDNTDLFSIPDSTVLFKITVVQPEDAKYCRSIQAISDSIPLEVIHYVDDEPKLVPMRSIGRAYICPIVPVGLSLETADNLTPGNSIEVEVVATDIRTTNSYDITVQLDEGLKITAIDTSYTEDELLIDIIDSTTLRVSFDTIENHSTSVWSTIPRTIFSFTVKAESDIVGCKKIEFVRDSVSLNAIKRVKWELRNAGVYILNELEYCYVSSGLQEIREEPNATIFPNPNIGNFSVHLDEKHAESIRSNVQLVIRNINGNIVYQKVYPKEAIENIQIEGISKGMYFVELISEGWYRVEKLVVQSE